MRDSSGRDSDLLVAAILILGQLLKHRFERDGAHTSSDFVHEAIAMIGNRRAEVFAGLAKVRSM